MNPKKVVGPTMVVEIEMATATMISSAITSRL